MRGVFCFHLKQYDEALKEFKASRELKEIEMAQKKAQYFDFENILYGDGDINIENNIQVNEDEDSDLLELLEI